MMDVSGVIGVGSLIIEGAAALAGRRAHLRETAGRDGLTIPGARNAMLLVLSRRWAMIWFEWSKLTR